MASVGVGLLGAAGVFSAVPVVGWVVGIAAAYIDARYIMPGLAGKGKEAARPPRLLDVPVGSNEAGAPRIWAIGGGVRIQTHILWQSQKVREVNVGSNQKGGTNIPQRQVLIDCLLAVNDRKTEQITQLIGNGGLLVWTSRNLVRITTSEMTAAVSGADVVVTMSDTQTPDPTDVFKVGDIVRTYGWVTVAGPSINGEYWNVAAIVPHGTTPGSITLQVINGQSVTAVSATGGDPFTPAWIERVDDALFVDSAAITGGQLNATSNSCIFLSPFTRDALDVFNVGDVVTLRNFEYRDLVNGPVVFTPVPDQPIDLVNIFTGAGLSYSAYFFPQDGLNGTSVLSLFLQTQGQFGGGMQIRPIASNRWPRVDFAATQTSAGSFFNPQFVPANHYHSGSETQTEEPILVASKGTGNVPAYRGVAYQAIDDFNTTQFGNQLPYSLEAIIRPDVSMTWAQAMFQVIKRAGIPSHAIDTSGITSRPFLGFYLRGAVATTTAVQPLLLAGSIIGQERDGTIALFHIDNADVVQIENGSLFSDLGSHEYGDTRNDDKVTTEDGAIEDLPTSVGVRHQDPDNALASGYQHFGLRNPNGVSHENRQEIDLSNLVLSRKDARNLAATTVRRAWINNRTYRFELSAAYLDLLENDLVTFTDDDGNIITARVIQRDIGSNFSVKVTAIAEEVELSVQGSPVQSGSGLAPPVLFTAPLITSIVLDIPSLDDQHGRQPGLVFASCANLGGTWSGVALFESLNGSDWVLAGSMPAPAAIGYVQSLFVGDNGPSEVYGSNIVSFFDLTVTVAWASTGAGISSCTQADALAGRNWCAIVWDTGEVEIAAFTTATLTGTNTYDLSGWLRGLRGTFRTSLMAETPIGSRIVMLDSGQTIFSRSFPGLLHPQNIDYKFVPTGLTVDDVPIASIDVTWRNARPLPLRVLTKTIGASPFDARLETENWTKTHIRLGSIPPYPMDEPFEAYRFTIYDPSGNAIRRTKTISAQNTGSPTLRDTWVTYTAAEQTADGYTPGPSETFVVDVQQIGEFGLSDSVKQEV